MNGLSAPPILTADKKGPWRTGLDLYKTHSTFKALIEFFVIGAVVLAFLQAPSVSNLGKFVGQWSTAPKSSALPNNMTTDPRLPQNSSSHDRQMPLIQDVVDAKEYLQSLPSGSEIIDAVQRQVDERRSQDGPKQALQSIRAEQDLTISLLLEKLSALDQSDPRILAAEGVIGIRSSDPMIFARGLSFLKSASAAGEMKASAILGLLYVAGHSQLPRDVNAGRALLDQAAAAGDAKLAFITGVGYVAGWIGTVDLKRGAALVKLSAERGYEDAAIQYSDFLKKGIGVDRNLSAAAFWMEKAADLGSVEALTQIGMEKLSGYSRGIIPNAYAAIDYLDRAASKGSATAAFNLAMFFLLSRIETGYQDNERAAALLKMCTEIKFYYKCMFAYAAQFENGIGVAKDIVKAYSLYRVVFDVYKQPKAKDRIDGLEKILTAKQISEGLSQANLFKERIPKNTHLPVQGRVSPRFQFNQ